TSSSNPHPSTLRPVLRPSSETGGPSGRTWCPSKGVVNHEVGGEPFPAARKVEADDQEAIPDRIDSASTGDVQIPQPDVTFGHHGAGVDECLEARRQQPTAQAKRDGLGPKLQAGVALALADESAAQKSASHEPTADPLLGLEP